MTAPTTVSYHGHALLHLLLDSPNPHTRASLAAHFGPAARFHTCSTQDLTLEQLLDFLVAREKIVQTPAGHLVPRPENICGTGTDHGHDHHDGH